MVIIGEYNRSNNNLLILKIGWYKAINYLISSEENFELDAISNRQPVKIIENRKDVFCLFSLLIRQVVKFWSLGSLARSAAVIPQRRENAECHEVNLPSGTQIVF